jgi:hypothetical protein
MSLIFRGRHLDLENVLLDTGSATTIFSADRLLDIDLRCEPRDILNRIRGVGGTEFVFSKTIDRLFLGALSVTEFEVEVGAMDYGFRFDLDGIVGMDFLEQVGAVIDLGRRVVTGSSAAQE